MIMNDHYRPKKSYAWQTPGEIFGWLQQRQFQINTIEFDGRWYLVQGLDPDGRQVEMKVNPQTRTVFTWILRSGPVTSPLAR